MVYRTNVDAGVLRLFDQLDAAFPHRDRSADGTIGDAAHQTRESDHNPQYPAPPGNPPGQIDAGDYTQDPAHGADMAVISEAIRRSHDVRVKYVIFNRRIFYGADYRVRFVWQPYDGTDPHTGHMHVSVRDATHDQAQDWDIGTGDDDMTPVQANQLQQIYAALFQGGDDCGVKVDAARTAVAGDTSNAIVDKLDAMLKELNELKASMGVNHTHTVTVTGAGGTGPAQPLDA